MDVLESPLDLELALAFGPPCVVFLDKPVHHVGAEHTNRGGLAFGDRVGENRNREGKDGAMRGILHDGYSHDRRSAHGADARLVDWDAALPTFEGQRLETPERVGVDRDPGEGDLRHRLTLPGQLLLDPSFLLLASDHLE